MNYIVREERTDLRSRTTTASCYGPFNAPTSARDWGWERLRAIAKELKESLSCASNGVPDQDLFHGYSQVFYSDTHRTVILVSVKVESLKPAKCDILEPEQPSLL